MPLWAWFHRFTLNQPEVKQKANLNHLKKYQLQFLGIRLNQFINN